MAERREFDPTSQILLELTNKYGMKNIPPEELAKLGYTRDEEGGIIKLLEVKEEEPLKELPARIKLSTPEYEDFNGDYRQLVRKSVPRWRRNHQKLLKIVKSGLIPFFGIHGTNQAALEGIKQTGTKLAGDVMTFYSKDKSEKFLYQLYEGILYAVSYTIDTESEKYDPETLGGIMVFNLEKNGDNITHEFEHLGAAHPMSFTFDSKTEQDFYAWLGETEDHSLSRSSWGTHDKDEYNKRYKGTIYTKDLAKYFTRLTSRDLSGMTRNELRRRFLAQEILARSLELLRENHNSRE